MTINDPEILTDAIPEQTEPPRQEQLAADIGATAVEQNPGVISFRQDDVERDGYPGHDALNNPNSIYV